VGLQSVSLTQSDGQVRHITPSKIVCIGRNYVEHIHELGNEIPDEMVVFLKPNSAITTTLRSHLGEPLHYEAELCFMVNNGQFSAVGVGLDMTKRELQAKLKKQGLPWERAKAFDGSALFSEFIAITPDIKDWCFQLTIDHVVTQLGHQQLMMYQPQAIFNAVSEFMTLNEGDIVMTGTPKGVGEVSANSHFVLQLWANILPPPEPSHIGTRTMSQPIDAQLTNSPPLITHQWQAI
jgi:2-keto-4-pentenoate hydratase/2-oxohepta-3-ene-1,7-dioic acid hydratase in catechol pathway